VDLELKKKIEARMAGYLQQKEQHIAAANACAGAIDACRGLLAELEAADNGESNPLPRLATNEALPSEG